jgi:hypothetical protein
METALNPRLVAGGAEYLCRTGLRLGLDTANQVARTNLLYRSSLELSNWQLLDSRTILNSGLGGSKQG